jgi:foldase protein PrsA
MRRTLRLILPVFLVTLLSLGLVACGGSSSKDIPGNAVAKVGDASITKDDFTHWLNVSVAQAGQGGQKVELGTPPDFAACVAQRSKQAPKPAKGQPKTTDAQYKDQCKQQYDAARDQVMSFLISSQWIEQEAAERNIKVTDADVQKEFDKTKKQSFPKDADYQKFLKSSGMTQDDILFRVKLDTLSNKLRESIVKGKDNVTPQQISDYYAKNKQRFSSPEVRDVRIVLTKTQGKADEAKQALQGGQSWKAVAKQYSIDEASKGQGGQLTGVAKGQQEKALDTAIFGAKKGQLSGPVKTQFGWYVFEVDKVTPAKQQTEKESEATIKQLLASQGQQKALDAFVKGFQKQWKDATNCREGYVTQDCSNAPKQKTNTATTPTNPAPAQTAP